MTDSCFFLGCISNGTGGCHECDRRVLIPHKTESPECHSWIELRTKIDTLTSDNRKWEDIALGLRAQLNGMRSDMTIVINALNAIECHTAYCEFDSNGGPDKAGLSHSRNEMKSIARKAIAEIKVQK